MFAQVTAKTSGSFSDTVYMLFIVMLFIVMCL